MSLLLFRGVTLLVLLFIIDSDYAVLYQYSTKFSSAHVTSPWRSKDSANKSFGDLQNFIRQKISVRGNKLANTTSLSKAQAHFKKRQTSEESTKADFETIGEFSLFYANKESSEWGAVTAAVDITLEYYDENDVRANFAVHYDEAREGFYFKVNNKMCGDKCTAIMPQLQDVGQLALSFVGDKNNIVTMARSKNNATLFYYLDCQQPLEQVKCRSKLGFPFCICNGYSGSCTGDAELLTGTKCSTAALTSTLERLLTTRSISDSTVTPINQATALTTFTFLSTTTKKFENESATTERSTVETTTDKTSVKTSVLTTVCMPVSVMSTEEPEVSNTKSLETVSSIGSKLTFGKPISMSRATTTVPDSASSRSSSAAPEPTTIPLCWNVVTKSASSTEQSEVSKGHHSTTRISTVGTTAKDKKSSKHPFKTSSVESIYTTPSTPTTLTTQSNDDLKELSEKEVDLRNVSRVLNETLQYSEQRTELKAEQIQEITTILEKCANLNGIQPKDSQKVLLNMDCILSADVFQIRASGNCSQRLIGMLPALVHNTNASSFDFLNGENLGFTSTVVDCNSSNDIMGLVDKDGRFGSLNKFIPAKDDQNSIVMSTIDICNAGLKASHMFMTIYRNRKLFLGPKQYNVYKSTKTVAQKSTLQIADKQRSEAEEVVPPSPACARQIAPVDAAPVMSGTLISDAKVVATSSSEAEMAVLTYGLSQILHPLHGRFQVTWWDTEALEWSADNQCDITIKDKTIIAQCNHLTDFALIVDAALNDPNVCEKGLIVLGYSVNILSIISLSFVTTINACAYWSVAVKTRTHMFLRGYAPPQRDFVSLSHKTSMLLFYLLFTVFSDQSTSGKACSFFASFSYMFLMSTVSLTIFQALRCIASITTNGNLVGLILAPSTAVTTSFMLPFTASLLLLLLTNFFHRGDCFCWVRPDYVVYAVIIPTSAIILNALLCTTVMCRKLLGDGGWSGAVRHHRISTASRIGAIFVMQISLGMPWALQYLTLYSPAATIWHYVFTIVMGSQGTVLAVLFFFKRRQSASFYHRSIITRLTNVESSSDVK